MNDPILYEQRNVALHKVYSDIIHTQGVNLNYLSRLSLLDLIAKHPAPRFYITPELAGWYICQYYRNNKMPLVKPNKQQMVLDLVFVYERLRAQYPDMHKWKLYAMVVEHPAKSFYMRKQRIKEIIFGYTGRNGKRK